MSSYESIIGQALFSGDHDLGIARAAVKCAVQTRMICECGNVLDQSTAVYLEKTNEKPLGVLCPACYEELVDKLPSGLSYLEYTWDGMQRVDI